MSANHQEEILKEYHKLLGDCVKPMQECGDEEIRGAENVRAIESVRKNLEIFKEAKIHAPLLKKLEPEMAKIRKDLDRLGKTTALQEIKIVLLKLQELCGEHMAKHYAEHFSKDSLKEIQTKTSQVTDKAKKAIQTIENYQNVKDLYEKELDLWTKSNNYASGECNFGHELEMKDLEIREKRAEIRTIKNLGESLEVKNQEYKNLIKMLKNPLRKAQNELRKNKEDKAKCDEIRNRLRKDLESKKIDLNLLSCIFPTKDKKKKENKKEDKTVKFLKDDTQDRKQIVGCKGTLLGYKCFYNEATNFVDLQLTTSQLKDFLKKIEGKKLDISYKSFSLLVDKSNKEERKEMDEIVPDAHSDDGSDDENENLMGAFARRSENSVSEEEKIMSEVNKPQEKRKEKYLDGFDSDSGSELDDEEEVVKEEDEVSDDTICDLTKLLNFLPITLSSFTFNYKTRCPDLEKAFNLSKFIRGLIFLGVEYYSFNNVCFMEKDDQNPNVECFKKIFKETKNYLNVKFLNFYDCEGVDKLDDAFKNLSKLETLAFCHCGIEDHHLEKIKEICEPFTKTYLSSLNLNHNKISNAGYRTIDSWVNGAGGTHLIRRINLFNNCIKGEENPQDPKGIPKQFIVKQG